MKAIKVVSIIIIIGFFVIGLVGGSVYAQGSGGSEPGSAAVGAESTTAKIKISSSAASGESVVSEENVNISNVEGSNQKLRVVTINANGDVIQSEPQSEMTGTDLISSRKGLPSAVNPSSPNVIFPTHWFGVLAAGFAPSSSSITYDYGGVGCVHATALGQWRAAVNLPDGAVAKYIYFQYYNPNTSAGVSSVWLTRYHWSGSYNDLVGVSSNSVSAGFSYIQSPEITQNNVIDNLNYVYGFVWSGSTTQYFCSMQVGYYPPGSIAYLPQISK